MKKISLLFLAVFLFIAGHAQLIPVLTFDDSVNNFPANALTLYNGVFYGFTGQYPSCGAAFRINPDGTHLKVLHRFVFEGGMDGCGAVGQPAISNGVIYGQTDNGQAPQGNINPLNTPYEGIIYKIDTDGNNYTMMYNFDNTFNLNGQQPNGTLVVDGQMLYGQASGGGINDGVIYSFSTSNYAYNVLHYFVDNEGVTPARGLIQSGNMLYGMMTRNGINSLGFGTVFSFNINTQQLDTLVTFTGTNGAEPQGMLTLSGNTLYGTTRTGGAPQANNGYGNIFCINTDGSNFKVLHTFSEAGTVYPCGSLVVSGNHIYGTATGDNIIEGSVFGLNTDGTGFHTMANFCVDSIGCPGPPFGGLTLYQNYLYGMTTIAFTGMLIYKVDTNAFISSVDEVDGVYTNLYPNPNNGDFVFSCGQFTGVGQMDVYNALGQLVCRKAVKTGSQNITLPQHLPGVFFYQVHDINDVLVTSGKWVIE